MNDLFNAMAARDKALAQVDAHADATWKEAAYEAVIKAATELRQFTADDVYDRMPIGVATHEPRALGPVMLRVCKEGLIVKADTASRPSRRRSLHASPRTVWNSKVTHEA